MADRYLLESGSPDGYLLEDGSGVLLLDAVTPLALTDNFDANSIDGAKWAAGNLADPSATTTGVTVADTSQQLQITGPASTAAVRYNGLVSVSTYDFTDHAIFVKIPNAASIGSFQLAFLIAGVDVNNKYSLQISGGANIQLVELVGGGQTAASAQISVGSDVWFRLRHTSTGDQIIVDSAPSTASDPPVESDWTQRTALPRNSSVGAVTAWSVALNGGLFNSNATPTTIQFDGFNTATTGGGISPSKGHLSFTGYQSAVTLTISPSVGHLTLGGKVPSVTVGTSVSPAKGAIIFGGKQPSLSLNIGVSPSLGHLTLGGKVPTVTRTTAVSPSVGHIVLTGKTPSVVLGVNVVPSVGHLILGGKVPSVSYTFKVSPSAGHLAFGGKVPTVVVSSGLTPSTGHIAYSGKIPLITTTLNPATGHITFAGHASVIGLAIGLNTGHVALTGHVPSVTLTTAISPLLGHLTLGGYVPTVTFGVGALGHIKVNLGILVIKPVKFWSGTGWVTKPLKRWTGTGWQETSY